MKDDRNVRFISWLSGIAVTLIAVFSFAISYAAQRELALAAGIHPMLAYIFPLVIDGFILVASLSVLRNSLVGERSIYQWVMIFVFTLLSIVFNAAHAHKALLELKIMGLPVTLIPHITMPLALFFGFEMLMRQVHNAIARAGVIKSLSDLRFELEQKQAELTRELSFHLDEIDNLSETTTVLGSEISEKPARIMPLHQESSRREQTKRNTNPAKIRQFTPGDLSALDKANRTRAAAMETRRKEIPVMLEAGRTVGELAHQFGVDVKTIQRDAAILGITLIGRGKNAKKDTTQTPFVSDISGNGTGNLNQPEITVPEMLV